MAPMEFLQVALRRTQGWLRPLTHAGIPCGTSRVEERELMVANIVVIFSIVATVPDLFNFLTFNHIATNYAAISLSIAISAYVIGFLLLSIGHRFAGLILFTNAVLLNLSAATFILGTRCGTQYYFIAVGIGAMLVWPRDYKYMRIPQAALGFVLFVLVMHTAGVDPIMGPPLPREIVDSVLNRQTIGSYAITFALAFYSLSATQRAETALEKEHQQSESLLLNILPQAIATRLKQSNDSIADSFEEISILFADVVGFTPMSGRMPPDQLVGFLNRLFSEFDRLVDKHGLEKIKTIGDAYMVASGIPVARSDHACAIAEMALEMQQIVRTITTPGGEHVQLRIGINSGPAIAGVIGIKKFTYDLWGDTVNTASRMESHGIPGAIQVTADTHQLLENDYELESRGIVEVKGKGPMSLYLLKGRKADG